MPKRRYALFWTDPALHDLLKITQHIKVDKPIAAQQFGKEIKQKVSRLAEFPHSGRIVPEFQIQSLRELLIGGYRIIYRIISSRFRIEILSVFHGAQEMESPNTTRKEL